MFTIFRDLAWFFRAHWRRYTIAIGLLVFVGFLEIIPPYLIGMAIDEIHMGQMTAERLTHILLFYVGLLIAVYIITYVWMYQLFGGAFVVERLLRSRFMRHLLRMSPAFFEKFRTGDLMARATNDLKAISVTAGFGVLTLLDSTVWFLVLLFTMGFLISWPLTFAALLPLPIIALAMRVYGKHIQHRFRDAQHAFGDMNQYVLENVSGVRVVRAYSRENNANSQFHDVSSHVHRKNMGVARVEALFEPTITVLVGLSYTIGLSYGAYLVFNSTITLGELVSFNVYLGMLIWPMFAFGELINMMQRGNASMKRVRQMLDHKPDIQDPAHPQPVHIPETIRFENVAFRYPESEHDQLQHISLHMERGETLGVVGRTGSGKTTLIKLLLREYDVQSGHVRMNGIPIEEIALDTLHANIAYVPQAPLLFSRTIRENIQYGKTDADDHDVQQAVQGASFADDIRRLPLGLETKVGEKGVALSGGQKQRASIARAFISEAEILILDDALSAVDAATETRIMRNIRELRQQKTTIIAAHRLSAVEHADQIIVLDDGHIAERGTHTGLMQQNGWYRRQYEHQQMQSMLKKSNLSADEGREQA